MAAVSSCREVSCQVRQRARPAFLFANVSVRMSEHNKKTASETERKVQATPGLYAPNLLGYTRATMIGTMGCNAERRSETSKPNPSAD
jgi:hypothetical protein